MTERARMLPRTNKRSDTNAAIRRLLVRVIVSQAKRGICPRACPLRRLRASSPKGRALGKTENIHSDTFPALTVVRYLKRGRVYQNSHLSGCAPADQFCAGSVVPAGGGTGQRPAVQQRAGSLRGGGGCGFLAGAAGPPQRRGASGCSTRAAPGRWPWPRPMAGRGGGLLCGCWRGSGCST